MVQLIRCTLVLFTLKYESSSQTLSLAEVDTVYRQLLPHVLVCQPVPFGPTLTSQ